MLLSFLLLTCKHYLLTLIRRRIRQWLTGTRALVGKWIEIPHRVALRLKKETKKILYSNKTREGKQRARLKKRLFFLYFKNHWFALG